MSVLSWIFRPWRREIEIPYYVAVKIWQWKEAVEWHMKIANIPDGISLCVGEAR